MKLYFGNTVTTVTTIMVFALMGFIGIHTEGAMGMLEVLPAYRRRGIASALTSRLAFETFARGRVPFYCAAWSNLRSAKNALRCGFAPAWVELTFKPEA